MILTVTLNPVLDKDYQINNFAPTGTHRVLQMSASPAGKGINVSKVLQQLSTPTRATGILGGQTGKLIEAGLNEAGIENDFVWIRAESRCSILIADSLQETYTEIIEPGPFIPPGAYDRLSRKLRQLAPSSSWVVLAGSPPPDAPPKIYYRLIKEVQQTGARVLLDTKGPWLAEGIKAGPDLIKPNWDEFLELVGSCYSTVQAIGEARRLVDQGLGGVVVSMGSKGAIAVFGKQAYFSKPLPPIKVVNPIGCGDALVAGLVAKLEAQWDFASALRFALAVGTSCAAHSDKGVFDPKQANLLGKQILVEKVPY